MAIVYRAVLTSSDPIVKDVTRAWTRWARGKLNKSGIQLPESFDHRVSLASDDWRVSVRPEVGKASGSTGRWFHLYEPPNDEGTLWITSIRATDIGRSSRHGVRGIAECVLTVRGNTTTDGVAAPRVVRDVASAANVSVDPIGLRYEVLEAGTADPFKVQERWAPIEKWFKVPARGIDVDGLFAIVDNPDRSIPVLVVTNADKIVDRFEDARRRAARIAQALAGSATVVFVAGPEGHALEQALGPALAVRPWSGGIRVIPPGVTIQNARSGDAPLIPWRLLSVGEQVEARVVGQRVLPLVANRLAPQWIRDVWDDLEPERFVSFAPVVVEEVEHAGRAVPASEEAIAPLAVIEEKSEALDVKNASTQLLAFSELASEFGVGLSDLPSWMREISAENDDKAREARDERIMREEAQMRLLEAQEAEREAVGARESMQRSMIALAKSKQFIAAETVEPGEFVPADIETCEDVLEWAMASLKRLRISDGAVDGARHLDSTFRPDRVKVWASVTLNGLLALNAFATACEEAGRSVGAIDKWVVANNFSLGGDGIAMSETGVTKDQFGKLREFQTLDEKGKWSGTSRMYAHVKVGHDKIDQPQSPRMHFEYVDSLRVVVIGYLGEHLTSKSSARL
jgi:hypothetical protein